jgi:ferredoxin
MITDISVFAVEIEPSHRLPGRHRPCNGPREEVFEMAYVITEKCEGTCDTACVEVCPVDCIAGPLSIDAIRSVPSSERQTRLPGIQLYIDPVECICCAACLPECPVDAILDEDEAPRRSVEANAAFFAGRSQPSEGSEP